MYTGHVFAVGWLSMLLQKTGKHVLENPDFNPDTKSKVLVLQMHNLHLKKKKSALCSLLIPIGVQGCQENECSARCFVLCASIYQKFRCSIN